MWPVLWPVYVASRIATLVVRMLHLLGSFLDSKYTRQAYTVGLGFPSTNSQLLRSMCEISPLPVLKTNVVFDSTDGTDRTDRTDSTDSTDSTAVFNLSTTTVARLYRLDNVCLRPLVLLLY